MYANHSIALRARSRFLQRQMERGRVQTPCITRGVSYTKFPKDRLGKGNLDRCGRAPKTENTTEQFDESAEYASYKSMMEGNRGVL
jgi:hypothetical protein